MTFILAANPSSLCTLMRGLCATKITVLGLPEILLPVRDCADFQANWQLYLFSIER